MSSLSSGESNSAFGAYALNSASSGASNSAFGKDAGYSMTSGSKNSAFGEGALYWNRAKGESVAVGYFSMYNADNSVTASVTNNTAVGAYSLRGSTTSASNTGIRNTAIGHSALLGVSSGSGNIALGYNSGSAITTGSNNVIIGSNTGSTVATSSNNIIIADGAGNTRIQVDSLGNIGIGMTSPSTALDVSGAMTAQGMSSAPSVSASNTGRIYYDYSANKFKVSQNGGAYTDLVGGGGGSGDITNGGNSTGANIVIGTNDNNAVLLETNNTTAMTISQGGNVGIGTSTPAVTLDMGSKTDGVRMPNGTTAQQVTCNSGAAGTMRYNTTTTFMEYCDGTNWNAIPKVQSAIAPTVPASDGYLVLTNTTWDGNLGGLAGANTKCLTEISTTYTNWMGYADANSRGLLVAAKVKALLCDNSNCNNLTPLGTYYFAVANQPGAGGASLTADASGMGPNDSAVWSAANRFNGTATYWSNRGTGSASLWQNAPYLATNGGTCSYWLSSANTVSSRLGSTGYGDSNRWTATTLACDIPARLICIVNP